MNFLKKKLKPLTAGLTSSSSANQTNQQHHHKDLEDDLYDDYVVEAPPHPSELIALGVDPSEIDANDPEKLRDLYRKAKERGKDKQVNSVLLAKQREKDELEEKKRTREEWKFFDSLTSRVEQAVKESQKNLDHWKESSAVDKLTEPDYELHLTAEHEIKLKNSALQQKAAQQKRELELKRIEEETKKIQEQVKRDPDKGAAAASAAPASETLGAKKSKVVEELDEFGCPIRVLKEDPVAVKTQSLVVNELLEDFGIDLRTEEQKRAEELKRKEEERRRAAESAATSRLAKKPEIKPVARPRPRPGQALETEEPDREDEIDPFDTSFVAPTDANKGPLGELLGEGEASQPIDEKDIDPFDTSYINI